MNETPGPEERRPGETPREHLNRLMAGPPGMTWEQRQKWEDIVWWALLTGTAPTVLEGGVR